MGRFCMGLWYWFVIELYLASHILEVILEQ